MDYATISDLLDQVSGDLKYARKVEQSIPALVERKKELQNALHALEVVEASSNPVLPVEPEPNLDSSIETTAPEPSTDDAFSGGGNHVQKQELKDVYDVTVGGPSGDDETDHPADAAVEEIKALDDEPTGDMTTPPAPNGGMTGWSY